MAPPVAYVTEKQNWNPAHVHLKNNTSRILEYHGPQGDKSPYYLLPNLIKNQKEKVEWK